uniref:Co2+/Mg2+ efflux protein ApaG n=1 Tax=Flavobacterium sp. TaxID=239 RepID=UPI00404B1E66
MVSQITKGIKISVLTSFEGTYFKNYKIHFAFSYRVTIENQSKDSVQLTTRHWEIYDALNNLEVVDGEGVIGKKPVIKPGESYTYSSGCLLSSPIGAMKGYFNMVNFTSTRSFRVVIPSFKLSAPSAISSLFRFQNFHLP